MVATALFSRSRRSPCAVSCCISLQSSALPLSRSRFLGCRITAAPGLLKIVPAARCHHETERRAECCGEDRLAISTTVRSENIPPLPCLLFGGSGHIRPVSPILALASNGLIPSDKLAGRGLSLSSFIFPFLIPSFASPLIYSSPTCARDPADGPQPPSSCLLLRRSTHWSTPWPNMHH